MYTTIKYIITIDKKVVLFAFYYILLVTLKFYNYDLNLHFYSVYFKTAEGHPLSVYAIPVKTIVDGVVYFDRENDEDDQRLAPDPEQAIPTFMKGEAGHHVDACMEGAFLNTEALFHRHSH